MSGPEKPRDVEVGAGANGGAVDGGARHRKNQNVQTGPEDTAAPGQDAQMTPDLSAILGQAAWVMMRSAPHRHLFVADLEWLLLPPIACKQFRLWRRENMPVAFASWALLSDEAEARLIESLGATVGAPAADTIAAATTEARESTASSPPLPAPQPAMAAPRLRLAPGDWQSGPNLWLIDLVCPFGGIAEAAQQLREQTFKDRVVKTVQPIADGPGFEAGAWDG
ncbi:MAG: toxin-activating lysine-acyltransferase [Alphaproteobacteria bacterium]|nr:toxin-activating lysine-acyltransferase [Alphaproteobacteria bacterium]